MKTYYLPKAKKIFALFILCWLVLLGQYTFAQTGVVRILNTAQSDFTKLMDAYYEPINKGAGTAMAHGWHNTAEPMRLGRFDLRLMMTGGIVPLKDQTIDLNTLGFSNAVRFHSDSAVTAGLFSENKGVNIQYYPTGADTTNGTPATLTLPDGANLSLIPIPAIQFNLGLLWGTELSLRFIPPVGFDNNQNITENNEGKTKISLWGVGLKHDFQQWIPGFNLWPVKFSLAMGFSHASLRATTALTPEDANLVLKSTGLTPDLSSFSNQEIEFIANSFNVGLLFSRKLPIITFYGGVNIHASSTSFKLLGSYPITVEDTDPASATFGSYVIDELNDPYSVSRSFAQASISLGIRIKLGVFSVFVNHARGSEGYHNLSTGIGFGIYEN